MRTFDSKNRRNRNQKGKDIKKKKNEIVISTFCISTFCLLARIIKFCRFGQSANDRLSKNVHRSLKDDFLIQIPKKSSSRNRKKTLAVLMKIKLMKGNVSRNCP